MTKSVRSLFLSWVIYLFFIFLPFERLLTRDFFGLTLKISFALSIIILMIFLSQVRKFKLEIEDKLLILFVALSYLSVFWSYDQLRTLIISTIFLLLFSLFIALKKIISPENLEFIEKIIIWSGIWLSLFALWQYFADISGISEWSFLRETYKKAVFGFPRPQATFLEPLYLANYLFMPFYLSIIRIIRLGKTETLSVISLFLVSLVLALSLSRGAYIGLLVSTLFFAVLVIKKFRFDLKKFLFSLAVVFAGICLAISIIYFTAPKESFRLFISHAGVGDISTGESSLDRIFLSKVAIQKFVEQPWGVGAGAFGALPEFTKKYISGEYQTVNNLYLEILVEEGVLGLIIFLFFLVILAKKLYKNILAGDKNSLAYLLIGIAIFVQACFFSTLYIIPIWAYLALAWNQAKMKI